MSVCSLLFSLLGWRVWQKAVSGWRVCSGLHSKRASLMVEKHGSESVGLPVHVWAVRKQRGERWHAGIFCSPLCSVCTLSHRMVPPSSRWVFPPQLTISEISIIVMPPSVLWLWVPLQNTFSLIFLSNFKNPSTTASWRTDSTLSLPCHSSGYCQSWFPWL